MVQVATLDSEKWSQATVTPSRQSSVDNLCSGKAVLSKPSTTQRAPKSAAGEPLANGSSDANSAPVNEVDVEGVKFKVVWSCLLLVEMLMANLAAAAHFQSLATDVVGKVCELLRLFNSRTTQLVLGAGAIHSAAKLKSINAKHLALVSQCLGLVSGLLPHIRAALMAQLPRKQHGLLGDLDKIKQDVNEHAEKILAKFLNIVATIVETSLAPTIMSFNFDKQVGEKCSPFLDGVSKNVAKLHNVLVSLLPVEQLQDVFGRVFNYLDTKIPELYNVAHDWSVEQKQGSSKKSKTQQLPALFFFPTTAEGKQKMIDEVKEVEKTLEGLDAIQGTFPTLTKTIVERLGSS